jgi:hypothetical protein
MILAKQFLSSLPMKSSHIDKHLSEMAMYYSSAIGMEHYRLLTALSMMNRNSIILDIGTYKGASALALSTNPTNKVISYNIVNQLDVDFSDIPNIEFKIKDIYTESKELILSSNFILYDISPHNGKDELRFYEFVKGLGYTGTIIFDDIHLNGGMKEFWTKVDSNKSDFTCVGHGSGTGAVFFGEEIIIQ